MQIQGDRATVKRPMNVVALIYDGLCTFEFGIVAEIFGLRRPELGRELYRFSSVALEEGPVHAAGGLTVTATAMVEELQHADIIVIPGWHGKDEMVPDQFNETLREARQRGTRLLSICSGAYVLAAAGLLSGRKATTHWRYADDLQKKYPDIDVCADDLYIDEGDIITSAGSSAGIDACLHIVRGDYGAKIANSVARRLVMHAHRQGGQAQFIEQPLPKSPENHRLAQLMEYVRSHLADVHHITNMAERTGLTARTFQRRFLAYNGIPAMQWLTQERVARACHLLETTNMNVEGISTAVGFGNAETLRYHFRQQMHITPLDYRKRFAAVAS